MEFTLSEGEYSYLEWSPLNHIYSKRAKGVLFLFILSIEPSFLTLDDKGTLRLHYVKEKTEQDIELVQIVEPGEIFRSGKLEIDESMR